MCAIGVTTHGSRRAQWGSFSGGPHLLEDPRVEALGRACLTRTKMSSHKAQTCLSRLFDMFEASIWEFTESRGRGGAAVLQRGPPRRATPAGPVFLQIRGLRPHFVNIVVVHSRRYETTIFCFLTSEVPVPPGGNSGNSSKVLTYYMQVVRSAGWLRPTLGPPMLQNTSCSQNVGSSRAQERFPQRFLVSSEGQQSWSRVSAQIRPIREQCWPSLSKP